VQSIVGDSVGAEVMGVFVGREVTGEIDGKFDGVRLGESDVGFGEGELVGDGLGGNVGDALGYCVVGAELGVRLGDTVGGAMQHFSKCDLSVSNSQAPRSEQVASIVFILRAHPSAHSFPVSNAAAQVCGHE